MEAGRAEWLSQRHTVAKWQSWGSSAQAGWHRCGRSSQYCLHLRLRHPGSERGRDFCTVSQQLSSLLSPWLVFFSPGLAQGLAGLRRASGTWWTRASTRAIGCPRSSACDLGEGSRTSWLEPPGKEWLACSCPLPRWLGGAGCHVLPASPHPPGAQGGLCVLAQGWNKSLWCLQVSWGGSVSHWGLYELQVNGRGVLGDKLSLSLLGPTGCGRWPCWRTGAFCYRLGDFTGSSFEVVSLTQWG